jgi:CelD/BcsL family acetyltransferase involved in cellulose biosynthesis
MHLEILRTLNANDPLSGEWNELLACCIASHVPFLRYEYLSSWWKTLGGGEWKDGDLFTVLARNEDHQLSGVAPLFFTHNRDGEPALMLLGSIEISDYLDFIVRLPDAEPFIEALFALLDSEQAPAWRVLDLYNLPETSPSLDILAKAAERKGWVYKQERLQACPYIPLPGDWETYLASIDKKQRHEIRRKMRRAEENAPPAQWYIVEDGKNLQAEFDDFLSLMAQDPEKDRFLTPLMRIQMHDSIQAAFKAGWLQLSFMVVDGQKAAGYLNFDYAGHIWVYNSGLSFAFRELSPGWVLLGNLLKWANDHGRESFDFMRGDEDYKYRFGAVNRYISRAVIRRG